MFSPRLFSPRIAAPISVAYSRRLHRVCFSLLAALLFCAPSASTQAVSGPVSVAPIISTFAGVQSSPGYTGDGGLATSADMRIEPYGGVATDGEGNVYIADDQNSVIRMVPATSGTYFGQTMTAGDIYTVAGTGTACASSTSACGDGGLATQAQLNLAQNMTVDQFGNLYIGDTADHRIRMVPATSGTYFGQAMTANFIYTIAGNGTDGNIDGPATTIAEMSQINGVAVDLSGNVYVADGLGNNNVIRMVPAVAGNYFGQAMTVGNEYHIAGTVTGGYNGDGIRATNAELDNPGEVAVDSSGNVYFSDIGNNRVRMVPATGGTFFGQFMTANDIYTIAGNGLSGSLGDGGPATSAEFRNPKGISLDRMGNIYITDLFNNRVQMLAAVSGTFFGQTVTANDIYTIAGDGSQGYSGDGGLPTSAELYQPYGVALDGAGNLYIADTLNSVIRKVASATEFPVTALGMTSAPQKVMVQFTSATNVSGFTVPQTQTQSQPGAQEFTAGAVSGCTLPNISAGDTCTVSVTFSPQAPGMRFGALEAMNGPSVMVGSVGLTGVGTGPLGVFAPGTANVISAGTYTLSNVGGVAVAPTGDVYISDADHNRVVEVSATGTASLVNTGSVALNGPIGLAVDSAENLFISNTNSGQLVEVSASGVASVVNLGSLTLHNPIGLAEDASGDLFIADRANSRIVKVTASGVASVVSTGSLTLNNPNGVGVDSNGDLFIADRFNNRIVEVSVDGAASVAVSSATSFGGTTLNNPSGVAVDSAENIFITDLNNNRLVEYSATGVASVISTGTVSLPQPHDLVLDGTGDIYIANWASNASGTYTAVKVNQTLGALAFASSNMGVQSADSPKSATLQNAGNTTLTLHSDVTTMTTAQTSNSFNLDGSTACGIGMSLDPGSSCVVGVDFLPLDAGALTGFANITDNNLNAAGPSYAVQQIALSGTGTGFQATIGLAENPGSTVTFGTSVTVTATLTGSNGTPTGSITYTLDGVSQPSASLSGGVATFTLPGTLTVGAHSIMVNYAGDNNYTASAQQGFTLTVNPDTTTTTLSATPTSTGYDSSVTLTAKVTNTSVSPNAPVTTGTVTFYDGATSIGTGTVNASGVATLTTSALPAGTDNLTASYGATTDDAASTSSIVPVTISLSTSASDVLAIDTGYTGAYVPATMGVFQPDQDFTGGSGVYSTGNTVNVANAINAAPMSIYQSERWGPMTYAIPNLTPGSTYTVRLHFAEIVFTKAGQRVFNVGINGTPVLTNFDIFAAAGGQNIAITEPFEATADSGGNITIAFTNGTVNYPKISGIEILASQPSTTTLATTSEAYGSSVTLTATVTGTGFTPSGVVVFSRNGIPIGNGTITTTGTVSTATFATSTLPTGTNTITATYQGVGNFGPSTSTPTTVTISQATPAITWAAPSPITYGTALSATQLDATSTTAGTFTYSSLSGTVLSAGPHTLTATFTPTDTTDYSTATATVSLTVNQATLTVTANNASRLYGAPNPTFTGTVTGAIPGDTFTESFSTAATSSSPIGSYPIVPSVTGSNLSDYSVITNDGSLMVSMATSSSMLLVSSNAITVGQSVTLTAIVTGAGSAPVTSGTVNFVTTGSILLGSAPVGLNGEATLATTNLPVGIDQVTASYLATPDDTASTSTPVQVTVSAVPPGTPAPSTTTLTDSLPSITYGQSETLTATVMAGGSAVTSGTVNFTMGANTIGAAAVDASGVASMTTTQLPAGTDHIVATFVGTANDATSISASVTVTVTASGGGSTGSGATSNTVLTASPSSVNQGQSVTLTATVTPGTSGTPTGSVTFYYGVTLLGTSPLSNGTASLTTTSLGSGTDVLTAQYSGDSNFNGSLSPEIIENVSGPTVTIALSSNTLSIAVGASTTDTLTITPQGGFTGTLQLACANLPLGATCSFQPTTVTFGPGASLQKVQVTVATSGTAALKVGPAWASIASGNLSGLATVFWLPGWCLTALVGVQGKKKRFSSRTMHLLVLLLLLSGVGMMTACSGGQPPASSAVSTPVFSTPTGNSSAMVVVTGANNLAQVAYFNLTVH